jgi:cytochrome c556
MTLGVCAVFLGFAAFANDWKSESKVRARLYLMDMLDEYADQLDATVSNDAQFDQDAARTAAAEIGELARRIPLLFPDYGPSDLPKIVDDFDGFETMSL